MPRATALTARATVSLLYSLLIFDASGQVYRLGDRGVSAPRIVSRVEAQYTARARQSKIEGVVILEIDVTEKGTAENFAVVKPLGEELDDQAVEAVRKWKFSAGEKDGKPAVVRAKVEVAFTLHPLRSKSK
jgi:protein TonB